jgi:hypothetical protein
MAAMKGDFSQYQFLPAANFTGTLYQQGRAFSDQDGNSADAIGRHLRTLLGRDTIGPHVVAVPAEHPDALELLEAHSDGNQVEVVINPGRAWVDGLHLYVPGDAPLTRVAGYFGPPVASPQPTAGEIAAGVRDAVVLEVWEEAFNAFQAPLELIEPALGGVDTTERVVLHHRLCLLRLDDEQDCASIGPLLADDLDAQGRLTVSPAPTLAIAGECPVQAGGGYTGFEHFLYRIEIAPPDGGGNARFKYSRFNGGLVGRGVFDNAVDEILIRANDQMINLSQLSNFYVEVLAPGPVEDPGHWRVVLTADASLVADGRLGLANIQGAWPGLPSDEAFFRLWDGIRLIADFPTGLASPNELEQGLRLEFDPPTADLGNYRPGDFWAFPVRAAGVDFDPTLWPTDEAPQGVRYHRAPLGILNWDAGPVADLVGPPAIHDCRRVFQPLTRIQTCCTYKVGDGMHGFGDFTSIQEAVDHLPASGGEICVLPGTYRENVVIDKDNVRIHGCGMRSRVLSAEFAEGTAPEPVFHVAGNSHIKIESLYVQADEAGIGVLVETDVQGVVPMGITLRELGMQAAQDAAIKVLGAQDVTVRDCRIGMVDVPSPWHAIYLRVDGALVEHNTIRVIPSQPDDGGEPFVHAGRGGLHLAGTSERVQVIDNLIAGGSGQGITLGSLEEILDGDVNDEDPGWIVDKDDPCSPCAPGGVYVPPHSGGEGEPEFRSAGALYDIRIERNRIFDMGLAGIGVVAFFDLAGADEFISVDGLDILGNEIRGCLRRELAEIPENMQDFMGFGAVTLADVESLRLYDNVIEDNGTDTRFPMCGVFILHGEGVDICRNRIINRAVVTRTAGATLQDGPRGGIVIRFAMPGIAPLQVSGEYRPRQSGEPAARLHDNIVSHGMGQALHLRALGLVSVHGNQFTSRGVVPRFSESSFLATAVFILNLGLSNEFYLQTFLFSGTTADPVSAGDLPTGSDGFIPQPAAGIDRSNIGHYLANGNVLFNDNQVLTDLLDPDLTFAISSVLILSLDDVTVQDNQLDCDFLIDILFTNLIAVGMTVRVNNNRFKESLFITLFSSVELGLIFNNTSDNQATHCFLHLTSPLAAFPGFINPSIRAHDNQVLFDSFGFWDGWCGRFEAWSDILVPGGVAGGNLGASNDFTLFN